MKRLFISILALQLATSRLLSQDVGGAQADMVKARAKQQRDINNQQQGIAPSAPGTPPGPGTYQAPATATAQPAIKADQQALIDRLETDLRVIKPGVPATPQNKTGLQTDIESLAKGANKPMQAATSKLAGNLADALADKDVTAKDLAQLSKIINLVMNCAPFSPPRVQDYIVKAQTILKSGGVSDANATVIGKDLTLIMIQIQKAKPKLYQ